MNVLPWSACPFNNRSPDAVDNRDANILDGPEQVLVGDEISPDGAAVGAADVLGQVVQEHSVHPENRELYRAENDPSVFTITEKAPTCCTSPAQIECPPRLG